MVNHPNRVTLTQVTKLAGQLDLIVSRSRVRQDDGLARLRWHATGNVGGYGIAPRDGEGCATLRELHDALQDRLERLQG